MLMGGATMVDLGTGGVVRLDGVDDKVHEVSRSIVSNFAISMCIAKIKACVYLSPTG